MTTDPDAPPQTVLPYGPGNRWTYSSKQTGYVHTEELALLPDPYGSGFTDGYTRDEVSAEVLWQMWVDKYASVMHAEWPDLFSPGELLIEWGVVGANRGRVNEYAPHARRIPSRRVENMNPEERDAHERLERLIGPDPDPEHFLTHFTYPVHAVTGEPINWLRLPVLDSQWNKTAADRGGFIQQVTGWKPSPLQPTMDVRQIGAAAGLYVPPL
ncbi:MULTISPECIES: hypothetical protein [Streptomyces]|uniref:hypothetical protein n=1 Tax=Streptomyces TaxID=1883 RepID=UPI0034307DAD